MNPFMDFDFSHAEENYLKAIYHLAIEGEAVSTNQIAEELQTKPASVSDMLKRLSLKNAINYTKYQGVTLTPSGKNAALWVIRKHRLWEVFLVEKLRFSWDEVHEVAEQLEHIKSHLMIERLDDFLGCPKYDPHGDPIPDSNGNFDLTPTMILTDSPINQELKVMSVIDSSKNFLQYLDKVGIAIGSKIKIIDKIGYDGSLEIFITQQQNTRLISKQVANNILVVKPEEK